MKFPYLKIATVALFASATPIFSGPDDTTKALMNESVSLLDWGNLRLQLVLNRRPYAGNYSYVDYDFDMNTINVLHIVDRKAPQEDAEAYCRRWFESIRDWAGYDKAGKLISEQGPFGLFSSLYAHNGYVQGADKDHAERLADLEKKFRLVVRHPVASGIISTGTMKCSGRLQGTEIAISID